MVLNENVPYLAVAVEYHPLQDINVSSQSRLATNVIVYLSILQALTRKTKIDIIVFPESTLTAHGITSRDDLLELSTEVPHQLHRVSPCFHQSTFPAFFQQLSCAAVAFDTYLVANLIERVSCAGNDCITNCSKDGWNFYNTNVAFDRNGTVVARYRKNNLLNNHYLNSSTNSKMQIIQTNFGIKMGILTGYDILFKQPSLGMIKDNGVRHFSLPSMWYSELPFLTDLQVYQQWAYENDVVLLAAGANDPSVGIGGSGIFQGRNASNICGIEEKGASKIHIATIPKSKNKKIHEWNEAAIDALATKMDSFYLGQENLTNYNSELLNISTDSKFNITLTSGCQSEILICSFSISIDFNKTDIRNNSQHYYYRIVAYSGTKLFNNFSSGGVEICGIIACVDEEINSCGKRFDDYTKVTWPITFKAITIKADFKVDENRVQYPNSLLSNIRPLLLHEFEWSQRNSGKENVVQRIFRLKRPQSRLMTFSIYGRNFNNDCYFSSHQQGCNVHICGGVDDTKSICVFLVFVFLILLSIK